MWTSNRFGFSELWMSRVAITHIGGRRFSLKSTVGGFSLIRPSIRPANTGTLGGATSRKLTGPAIALADPPIDLVLLESRPPRRQSHHAGREMLSQVSKVVTTVPASDGSATGRRRVGALGQGRIDESRRTQLEIVATPARYGPPGSGPIVGAVIGFALRWEGQENGVLWILRRYRPVRRCAEVGQFSTSAPPSFTSAVSGSRSVGRSATR